VRDATSGQVPTGPAVAAYVCRLADPQYAWVAHLAEGGHRATLGAVYHKFEGVIGARVVRGDTQPTSSSLLGGKSCGMKHHRWIEPCDVIELEGRKLGTLRNPGDGARLDDAKGRAPGRPSFRRCVRGRV
jgi:hypothetical protein